MIVPGDAPEAEGPGDEFGVFFAYMNGMKGKVSR